MKIPKPFLIPAVWMIFLISILAGCVFQGKKRNEWKPIEVQAQPVVHIVQGNDENLRVIAKWYTGDEKKRDVLADANPLINPDALSDGTKVFIPGDLVKTREPMPKTFILEFNEKEKQKEAPVKKPPGPKKKKETDFEVFGPK